MADSVSSIGERSNGYNMTRRILTETRLRYTFQGIKQGPHLALTTAIDIQSYGDPIARSIKSVLCIRRIFDLDPIRQSYLKNELKLDDKAVYKFSSFGRERIVINKSVFFAVGGDETNQFLEQSRNM